MKLYKPLLFMLALVIATACDIIEAPYTEEIIKPPVDTTKFVQNVLLEDYTGHKCGNCPEAAEIAHDLEGLHSGRVVILSVHAGFYATVNAKYPTDFNTVTGTELNSKWKLTGYPTGLINRSAFNGNMLLTHGYWDGAVTEALKVEPLMNIGLATDYDAATRKVTVTAEVEYKEGQEPGSSHYLAIYLKESGIIAEQDDYRLGSTSDQYHIKDYVHNHVLRTAINGTWGEQLTAVSEKEENKYTITYEYVIPADKEWVPENMHAVAFVHDFEGTWKVFQAEEEELISE